MVAQSQSDWLLALQQHLPPGKLTRADDAILTALLSVVAAQLAQADASAEGLYDEADPRTCYQLLPAYEAAFGLPDPAVGGATQSLVERRAWLLMRWLGRGGQSKPYFINLAAQLGVTITITEFQPWGCGYGMTGRDQISGDSSIFVLWQVNMPDPIVYYFQVGQSQLGDPLGYVRTGVIEALFQRWKPAHTKLIFNYGSD